jgi:serralysin
MSQRKNWICTTLEVPGGSRVQASPTVPLPMGVAAKNSLWEKGSELTVRFLQGSTALHERTLNAALSWFLDGVELQLRPAKDGEKGDIRIAFDPDRGSWSYVGTDAPTPRRVSASPPCRNASGSCSRSRCPAATSSHWPACRGRGSQGRGATRWRWGIC